MHTQSLPRDHTCAASASVSSHLFVNHRTSKVTHCHTDTVTIQGLYTVLFFLNVPVQINMYKCVYVYECVHLYVQSVDTWVQWLQYTKAHKMKNKVLHSSIHSDFFLSLFLLWNERTLKKLLLNETIWVSCEEEITFGETMNNSQTSAFCKGSQAKEV